MRCQPQIEHGGLIRRMDFGKQLLIAFTLPKWERKALGSWNLSSGHQQDASEGDLVIGQREQQSDNCSISQRGSPFRLFLLFLRFVLAEGEGKSRDSRRKGRGWGISKVWAEGIDIRLEDSMEVLLFSKGGEFWETAEGKTKQNE